MKTIKLTDTEVSVLRQSLDSVGWDALPEGHAERKAAASLKAKVSDPVTINAEQRLYVIPCAGGYSCLGFDVAYKWAKDVAKWIGDPSIQDHVNAENIGTLSGYREYEAMMRRGEAHAKRTNTRCPAQLTAQLIGHEGERVEVVDAYGETRRFKVGKSTGWLPIHLEHKTATSRYGDPVMGAPFQSVKVVSK